MKYIILLSQSYIINIQKDLFSNLGKFALKWVFIDKVIYYNESYSASLLCAQPERGNAG